MDHPSDDATRRLVRVVRTGLVASTAFLLAAGAHLGAGGRVPSGIGLVALLTLTLVVAATVSRWRLRATVLVPVAGALQLVLHTGFDWFTTLPVAGASGASPAAASSDAGTGAHAMAGMVPTSADLASLAAAHAGAASTGMASTGIASAGMAGMHDASGAMLWAHVAGTLATTVLLVLGDRAAARALVWWTAVLPAVLTVAAAVVDPSGRRVARPVVGGLVVRLRTLVLDGGSGRRGPPATHGARPLAPVPA